MGSTQNFPVSIFSGPFFTSFFVSVFIMAVSSFASFRFVRLLRSFALLSGHHGTAHGVDPVLGVHQLPGGYLLDFQLFGLSHGTISLWRLSLLSGRVPCSLRPAALSSFDANLAQQRRNRNRRQSESGIRQALSASSDGDSESHQTQSDEGPGDRLKKGSEDRVQGIKKGPWRI